MSAIILDFDGLILDTESPLYRSWQEVCEAYSVQMDHAWWAIQLTTHPDPPECYIYVEEHSAIPFDREQVRKRRQAREFQLIEGQEPLPGVLSVISQAKALALPLGIASNSERAWVTGHLARLGLLEQFNQIRCRDEVSRPKPNPDVYLAVLEALGTPPQEAVAFEDSPVGVAAAKAAGVYCVAVPNAVTKGLDFTMADRVISSLAGVSVVELIQTVE
jgi:HAD superfamily hydrolase (TIGR01509 family)